MNMSFAEIFLWLSQWEWPGTLVIWQWLISVPWWLAIATVGLATLLLRLAWAFCWSAFEKLSDGFFGLGQKLGRTLPVARRLFAALARFGRATRKLWFGLFPSRTVPRKMPPR